MGYGASLPPSRDNAREASMSMAPSSLPPALQQRIQALVDDNEVLLFMKGTRQQPQCGFSARVVGILDGLISEYHTVNVLADPDIRQGIKVFSDWPTIPQLYIKGEFVGGSDIVAQAAASGELVEMLGIELEEIEPPAVTVTDAAAARLSEATRGQPGAFLRFSIGAGFRYQLSVGPKQFGDVEVSANGVTLVLDRASAKIAEGTVIDFERQGLQQGFVITNPNEPKPVSQLSAAELKQWQDEGEDFVLVDVRTPRERGIAAIAGSMLLDAEGAKTLESLPKQTRLVFQCHHGMRSQQAAEYYRDQGFTSVYNLSGGIDAWSREVDGTVPRY